MPLDFRFRPKLLDSLRNYRLDDLRADLSAGVTVGIVALPLAMAFGIASGVKPEQGIFTAVIAGFLISVFGGSRVQIGGPAGAFVALLYAIVEKYGVANLMISVFMAGVLLFAMGLFRLGNLIRFIPVSIVIGFTNGIAVIIALQQVKDFFGLAIPKMPADFFSQIAVIAGHADSVNPAALAIALASVAIVVFWPKSYTPLDSPVRRIVARLPGTIIALAAGTLAVSLLDLQVETIGSRFGGIPQGLPAFALPAFDWVTAQNLVTPTISIALLCAIESLLCARVADTMIDDRHDPNQELMAQGLANFVAPFFGGVAATGTIARTVTNVRSGARSPVAGVVHSVTLLLVLLLLAPLAAGIPMAALAGILMVIAWNMGEWAEFARLRQFTLTYRTILLTTFTLTVVFDLTVAVQIGLVLACLFFIYRISALTKMESILLPGGLAQRADGRSVAAFRLFGSLFFGSVTKLEPLLDPQRPPADILILDLHQVINVDTSGLEVLDSLLKMTQKRGGRLIIAEPNEQPLSLMRRSGFLEQLGDGNLFDEVDDAIRSAALPDGDSA